jgi:hypothetical protein
VYLEPALDDDGPSDLFRLGSGAIDVAVHLGVRGPDEAQEETYPGRAPGRRIDLERGAGAPCGGPLASGNAQLTRASSRA